MASFDRFIELPPELRLAIWKYALPTRVVELDVPGTYGTADLAGQRYDHSTIRSIIHNWRSNARMPVIARLSHEAREIVLRHGTQLSRWQPSRSNKKWSKGQSWLAKRRKIGTGPIPGRTTEDLTWLDPSRDTLHLNWLYNTHYESDRSYDAIKALSSRREAACSLSILADMFLPFKGDRKNDGAVSPELLLLGAGYEYRVVLRVVCVHASLKTASKNGLFGLGGEKVVLCDALDSVEIHKYSGLLPWIDDESKEFLEQALQIDTFKTAIEQWQGQAAKLWVWGRWCKARSDKWCVPGGPSLQCYRQEIDGDTWPFTSAASEICARPGRRYFDSRSQLFQHCLNLDDNWVKNELSRMPKLRPLVMFRLCDRERMPPSRTYRWI